MKDQGDKPGQFSGITHFTSIITSSGCPGIIAIQPQNGNVLIDYC